MSLELKDQYDKIYKYCYFKVKNLQLAEDLTQETFLKFFSQNSYISRGKPLAYLYTIAKNLCIDTYRKTEMMPLDESISSENTLEDFETYFTIRQAIYTLPEDLQEIVFLRFVNELPMVEISNIIGISRFSVYRRINNALKELKLILREEDFS
ncbi:RNA polymerase sigma factor [Proteiniborus sp. MB09-C3]|uniref:RNA polymerase sigma factor n=1 Tax=Proteiniborus sp. MB09-C3 TaxID=3050072 RepID=UPI002553057C|nr:RNA polymerase sigma factor [Proteiniborus sp. MB09-C3]WIV13718.1 RNA polymerase sigma factor [Proteiniborus sp. MB09-C3]